VIFTYLRTSAESTTTAFAVILGLDGNLHGATPYGGDDIGGQWSRCSVHAKALSRESAEAFPARLVRHRLASPALTILQDHHRKRSGPALTCSTRRVTQIIAGSASVRGWTRLSVLLQAPR
jgi:hypothetical protein